MVERGLYVHVPYCGTKCPYCSFLSAPARDLPPADAYVEAAVRELDARAHGPFGTAFVGGGTPTVLPGPALRRLLGAIAPHLAPGAEWTVEANPGTVDGAVAEALAGAGVTRVSIGVQSIHASDLKFLGRRAGRAEAEAALSAVRAAGIPEASVDLIFGLPGQRLRAWRETLDWAIGTGVGHVSLYDLTIEEGTAFARAGVRRAPADRSARLYRLAIETLAAAGFEHYEVSNFARPGRACRHNLHVWRYGAYAGIGPGAHGFEDGARRWNVSDVAAYVERAGAGLDPIAGSERVDGAARAGEALVLALRLPRGLSIDDLPPPVPAEIRAHRAGVLDRLGARGLLEWRDPRLAPTARGLMLLDEVSALVV